jgi:integrase
MEGKTKRIGPRANSAYPICHDYCGELEQIQFLLGHVSVQTTERYMVASSV